MLGHVHYESLALREVLDIVTPERMAEDNRLSAFLVHQDRQFLDHFAAQRISGAVDERVGDLRAAR